MANPEGGISRRNFIKAAAAAGATLAVGGYFRNRNPVPKKGELPRIKPFNIDTAAGRFAVARGEKTVEMIRQSLDAVGGIKQYIQKGDRVLLKVNCAFARPAWMGATTSPEVAAEIVKLCRDAGAKSVVVTDNPISDAKSCFLKSGIGQAVANAGGQVVMPSPADFRVVEVSKGVIGPWEVLYEPLRNCDKVIGLPTLKSHNLCLASLAMKNWYGFIGGSRSRFHQNIHQVIAELGAFIVPTLVVLDGTRMLLRNGPTGGSAQDVVAGNTIVVSTDQVAVDAFGVEMLGLEKSAVEYLDLARQKGLGNPEYKKLSHYTEVAT